MDEQGCLAAASLSWIPQVVASIQTGRVGGQVGKELKIAILMYGHTRRRKQFQLHYDPRCWSLDRLNGEASRRGG